MAEYERDRKLKPAEQKKFREHLIEEALEHDNSSVVSARELSGLKIEASALCSG
jgi:hypothetical protein